MVKLFEISISGHGYVLAESEDQAKTVGRVFFDDLKRGFSSQDLEIYEESEGVWTDWVGARPFQDGTHPEKTCGEWIAELRDRREFDAKQLSLAGEEENDNEGTDEEEGTNETS